MSLFFSPKSQAGNQFNFASLHSFMQVKTIKCCFFKGWNIKDTVVWYTFNFSLLCYYSHKPNIFSDICGCTQETSFRHLWSCNLGGRRNVPLRWMRPGGSLWCNLPCIQYQVSQFSLSHSSFNFKRQVLWCPKWILQANVWPTLIKYCLKNVCNDNICDFIIPFLASLGRSYFWGVCM